MKDIYESPAVKKMQASQRVAEQWDAFALGLNALAIIVAVLIARLS